MRYKFAIGRKVKVIGGKYHKIDLIRVGIVVGRSRIQSGIYKVEMYQVKFSNSGVMGIVPQRDVPHMQLFADAWGYLVPCEDCDNCKFRFVCFSGDIDDGKHNLRL